MKTKSIKLFSLILALALLLPTAALAQTEGPSLVLDLNRDFGYGGFAGDIQGTFSMKAEGPANLVQVKFYIDEALLAIDEEPPFKVQFNTDGFEPGAHTLYAVGILDDGIELRSNEFVRVFLSSEEAYGKVGDIGLPLIGIILLLAVLGTVGPMLAGRKSPKRPIGEYGPAGGAVCPKCALPYSRHILSLNLGLGKLERCPHCSKWAIVRRASPLALAEAEDLLRADNQAGGQVLEKDPEEVKRRMLDSSRFED